MKYIKYILLVAFALFIPLAVFATPTSVDRITNRIEPLIKTDFIRGVYFVASSTTATSSFPNASTTNITILGKLFDRLLSAGTNGYVLQTNGTGVTWVATSSLGFSGGGSGTVTSVDMTVPTGLSITGNPITTSGTLALSLTGGYVIPLTASTTQWATAYASTTALTPAYIRGLLSGTSPITYNSGTGAIGLGTVDISSNTNLAVSAPITLTGDTLGFDFSTNNTWTGRNIFANASSTNQTISGLLYLPALSDGCLELAGKIVTSTGVACGSGGGGITSLNGLTGSSQTFASTSVGGQFNISSAGSTHTFNFPTSPIFTNSSTTAGVTVGGVLYLPTLSDGCAQVASGILTSTGTACGAGGGTLTWVVDNGFLRTSTTTDYAKAAYFVATSTTGTSTFAGKVGIGTTTLPATYKMNVVGGASRFGSGSSYYVDLANTATAGVFQGASNTVTIGGLFDSLSITNTAGNNTILSNLTYAGDFTGPVRVTGNLNTTNASTSAGLTVAGPLYMPGRADGCQTIAGGISTSTGSACGGAGSSPGGSSGQVQFNDSSTFGGASILYWDKVNSRLGIGTTTPIYSLSTTGDINGLGNLFMGTQYLNPQPSAFGTSVHPWQLSTSSNDILGLRLTNTSAGTLAGTGIIFTNGSTTRDVAGLSQSYYGGVFFGGGNFDGSPYGITALRKNDLGITVVDGNLALSAASTTGNINFFAGPNGFQSGTVDAVLHSSGNFGIGSSTPGSKLSVQGTTSAPTTPLFTVASSTNTVIFTAMHNGTVGIGSSTPAATLGVVGINGTNPLVIASSTGAVQAVVTQAGNFGIGTTTPAAKLEVRGSGGSIVVFRASDQSNRFSISDSGVVNFSSLQISGASVLGSQITSTTFGNGGTGTGISTVVRGSSGTDGILTLQSSNHASAATDEIRFLTGAPTLRRMTILNSGYIGIGSTTPTARLVVQGTTSLPTLDLFEVASSTNVSMFNVNSNGRVGIGSTTPNYLLSLAGTMAVNGLTTAAGTPNSICMNAASGEITVNAALTCTVSDEDQKSPLKPITFSALEMIMKMQPSTFSYNDNPDRERFGFGAQSLQKIDHRLADAYDENDIGRSIDLPALIAINTAAIQELASKTGVVANEAKRNAENNYQWIIIGLLVIGFLYQERRINKLTK